MSRLVRRLLIVIGALAVVASLAALASAQRHGAPRQGAPRQAAPRSHGGVHGRVFIGGYFYDPFWGPWPWWSPTAYPYWYYPDFDMSADIHVKVKPEEAAVYVDGFYAGIVDDFNGFFQSLSVSPGGHTIALYMEGYRTVQQHLYLGPGTSTDIHHTMEPLPPGERSEPPPVSQPVPQPPEGTYIAPHTPSRAGLQPTPPAAAGYGKLELRIQPATATLTIDGQPWVSTDHGVFVVEMIAGTHRIEVAQQGYQAYTGTIEIRERQTTPLNVSLMPSTGY